MCGIIAVLRRRNDQAPPASDDLLASLDAALAAVADTGGDLSGRLRTIAEQVGAVDTALRGTPGVRALLADAGLPGAVEARAERIDEFLRTLERDLDSGEAGIASDAVEGVNAELVRAKDAVWALWRDRLRTGAAVRELTGPEPGLAAVAGYLSVQLALSALDRLEVRGRDSAGLHLLVEDPAVDVDAADVRAEIERRAEPLFTMGAVRAVDGRLSFVYKAAAEIGELGDNTAALRQAIADDDLLRRALAGDDAQVTVLGHTRWASVGIISEANAHPLNSEEDAGSAGPYLVAALNGDVDNYAELRAEAGLRIPSDITTDAKVIPTLVSRRQAAGATANDAFRETVATFDGSVAIGASSAADPGTLHLALRGSGQALYVGLADDAYIVASEPYGVVEVTQRYLRMDGESASGRDGSNGQVVVLDRAAAGTVEGITRLAYDGTDLPVSDDDISTAEITTRDIDRRGYPHFLLKEVTEAPVSMRKTLRGKLVERDGLLAVSLPDQTIPAGLAERISSGSIRRILAIGQGTAAVAGQALAAAFDDAFAGSGVHVEAIPATELSGFGLDDDMSDTLIVAISQSGTTTDTNRTVDLARSRGAAVIGIVNRRNSDLVEKAHGVLYTSDGRDVEMAVPSTKAFYAQIAASVLLAYGVGALAGVGDPRRTHEILTALRDLPEALETVLGLREEIAALAQLHAPGRRYWAMVGNGPNKVAAQELRIKLSELCYKSIACDVTEDKKHIDLSSEPMIFVCATGLDAATADDVGKEVAIYSAHKALPIVVASKGARFPAATHLIEVPAVHPTLDFVSAAMAGHLFGYEAAVAIDAQARHLRELRAEVEEIITSDTPNEQIMAALKPALSAGAQGFFDELRSGQLNGHLEASTAVRLSSLLRYATGVVPLEAYEAEYGKIGSPDALIDDLIAGLTEAVDELTRPIDAIKHQAKTVTVGISRAEETFSQVDLVLQTLAAGAPRDHIGYRGLRTLAALDPAVVTVAGYTRYQIEGSISAGTATIHVVDQGGVARDIPSRTASDPTLKGTKRRAADTKQVWVARGARDGRTVILVPETKDNQAVGLTLLHVEFADTLDAEAARSVLEGYQGRYSALVDAVTETEPTFDDNRLAETPIVDLLVVPVNDMAQRWRS